mmetsp:Transcript_8773/g.15963  ORF Transcript_8773/g.15963 Transcript_8773/m.15963 type:complete len:187 (-) Transcript_8773:741-1301(-)
MNILKRSRDEASVGIVDGQSANYGVGENKVTATVSRKRPRTERYLQELGKFEKTLTTLEFFQKGLASLGKEQNDGAASPAALHQCLLQQNLSKSRGLEEQKFHFLRQQLVDSAQETLDVSNSIRTMREQALSGSTPTSCCPLNLLNRGEESTVAFFNIIAEYAGNPSECEIEDCEQLIAVACTDIR